MTMQLRGLDARVRPLAEAAYLYALERGLKPVVTSVFRSYTEQKALRESYERGLSRFPANRPGDSAHNYGLAFDSVVSPDQEQLWTAIRISFGWHVPANDVIHAEVPSWRDWLTRTSPVATQPIGVHERLPFLRGELRCRPLPPRCA